MQGRGVAQVGEQRQIVGATGFSGEGLLVGAAIGFGGEKLDNGLSDRGVELVFDEVLGTG